MPKIEKVGSGMTERKRVMYDVTGNNPGDIAAARDAFRAGTRAIGEKGLWLAKTEWMRFHCEDILDGKDRHDDFEADTPECFARRILHCLVAADNCIIEGRAQHAAAYGLEAGDLWAVARLKWAQEPTWETGNKQRQALGEGRDRTNRKRRFKAATEHEAWQLEADEIWANKPHLSKTAVAGTIATRHGGKMNTIRQAIQKPDGAG